MNDVSAAEKAYPKADRCVMNALNIRKEKDMKKKKIIDVLNLLPQEAVAMVDEHGCQFLREQGYSVSGSNKITTRAARIIREEMKQRSERLEYSGAVDKDTGCILFWFELYRNGERIARSKGIKFVPKKKV